MRVAFFFLFLFVAALSCGTYFVGSLSKFQESIAVRETQTALQGLADANQIEQALRQNPSNKILQLIAMAAKAAGETGLATETLLNSVEPLSVSKPLDWGTASRSDLEALGRDLKRAQANAATFMPRYLDLLKNERNKVEKHAVSLHVEKDTLSTFLDQLEQRHAKISAFASELLAARADFYRAYQNYLAVVLREFGAYKVVSGQLIFPFQRTVDRYNIAAHAMSAAGKRVAELEVQRQNRMQSKPEGWEQFVDRK